MSSKFYEYFTKEEVIKDLYSNPIFVDKMYLCGDEDGLQAILKCYLEPHRYYHNMDHLVNILKNIKELRNNGEISEKTYYNLQVIAVFHDIVYNPGATDNENNSCRVFNNYCEHMKPEDMDWVNEIKQCIMDTQTLKSSNRLSDFFICLDVKNLLEGNVATLISDGHKLFKEFQKYSPWDFINGRISFLNDFLNKMGRFNEKNIKEYMEYLKTWRPRIGIYAGSFDPFHVGHLNIVEKAEGVFDKVVLAIGNNNDKNSSDVYSREYELLKVMPYHEIRTFHGLLMDFVNNYSNSCDVTIVRGLRNSYDLNYEQNQLRWMEDFSSKPIPVVYFLCDKKYEHVSSSSIRANSILISGKDKKSLYYPNKYAYCGNHE